MHALEQHVGGYEHLFVGVMQHGAVIAHAFFGEKDVKFVNGLLDALAKEVRSS